MNPRTVDAVNGWQWIVDGFGLFRKSPVMWVALTLILAVMSIVVLVVPLFGALLFNLFAPVFFAGLMIGCRALENGEALELPHLFAGFKSNVAALVTVGGIYLAGTIIIFGVVFTIAGASLFSMIKPGQTPDPETAMAILRSMAIPLLIAMALYVPLMMAVWFAPVLITFHNLSPVDAIKLSFAANLANIVPFLIYGVIGLVLWIIASIPLALGLLVLVPVIFCSVYASYKDIFTDSAAPSQPNPLLK
jgi:uncharacterized membrane protein